MQQNGKVQFVSIERIKPAAFNPPSRIGHQSIKDLKASIERVGIIYPLIVTKDFDLVDGHRRLECARLIGMESVPVIVREGGQKELFNEVNTTSKKLTQADDLFVYLSGGSMTGRSKRPIELTEKLMGHEFLEYMAENKISPHSVLSVTGQVMKYIGVNDWTDGESQIAIKCIRWMAENKGQFAARTAIVSRTDPAYIVECIENNKPLR